jgi:hypothetical protein
MESLPDTFFRMATAHLAEYPNLAHHWSGPDQHGKRILDIPKAREDGFDIRIEAETYGLYPRAGRWHGAPWDAPHDTDTTNEEVCEDCLGFVRSALSPDATLTVFFASGNPYKWILSYSRAGTRVNDETGSLFFNYCGRRERRVFKNQHLESSQSQQQR